MEILHIFKTRPDRMTELFAGELSKDKDTTVVKLYADDIDWERLVDQIFSHDTVITWW